MSNQLVRLFLRTLVLVSYLLVLPYSYAAEDPQPAQPPQEKTVDQLSEPAKTTLIELYSWATILPKQLIDLQDKLGKEKDYRKVEEELPKVKADIEDLRWDTTMAQTNPEIQPIEVDSYQARVSKITQRLQILSTPINAAISDLTAQRKAWLGKKQEVEDFKNRDETVLAITEKDQQNLVDTIKKAIDLLDGRLKEALLLGKEIGDLQVAVYSIDKDLKTLSNDLRATSVQQTSPSMLSYEFYSRLHWNTIRKSFVNTKRYIYDQFELTQKNPVFFLFILFSLTLFSYGIKKTENLVSATSRWKKFSLCPLSTALFITISFYSVLNLLPMQSTAVSQRWDSLFQLLLLMSVMRLIPYLVETEWKKQSLRILTFFMLLTIFLMLLNMPQILIQIYVFYVSLGALIIWGSRLRKSKDKEGLQLWIARLWGLFPIFIVISGIGGYDQFAVLAFSTVLSTCIACLIIWVLYQLHLGTLSLIFAILPIEIIQENRKHIVNSLQPVIAWLHIFLLVAVEAVIWDFFPSINEALHGLGGAGFDIGELHVSPGFIFVVILVFYGSLITSQAIQALLLRNILPRYAAQKGVQLSITRLTHYAILTIGFFVMLNVLGFELKQLTILGGALGVGIGFGLQAIVNNFASGLILLFERPVKVGDTIQIGSDMGEVKKLGLRATVIQTFDNAEIVLPNSDLVTGQVTNWTLADRRVRVKIPVGVAYGTDIQKVLDILLACGNANPMVLSTPKPSAFFLAFGASSLDFELRVWIPEFLDNIQVKSDLNQEIESEFSLNGIEIPFPQQDLHIRSVAEGLLHQFGKIPPNPASGLTAENSSE